MRRLLATVCFLGVLASQPLQAESFNADQTAQIEKLVHDYLLKNPEILRDMANALEVKDKEAANVTREQTLVSASQDIFHNKEDAVVGNAKGDVTIVEFMDYNCGWCHKAVKEMSKVLEADKNVRIVMKEFPIFGEGSEYAAKAAMASARQGKYWEFHQALFSTGGQVTAAVVDKVAQKTGLDLAQLKKDMDTPEIIANIQKTTGLAGALQFTGTPGFLVGNQVFPGFETADKLLAAVAEIRAQGGCKVC